MTIPKRKTGLWHHNLQTGHYSTPWHRNRTCQMLNLVTSILGAHLTKLRCSLYKLFFPVGGASVPDHVQSYEQVDGSKQPSLPLHPGRQRHHGKVRCRGQTATSARETHLPAEDQHAWVEFNVSACHGSCDADLLWLNKRRCF